MILKNITAICWRNSVLHLKEGEREYGVWIKLHLCIANFLEIAAFSFYFISTIGKLCSLVKSKKILSKLIYKYPL